MFTQPIAMKCNQEQFGDIKRELTELGYKIEGNNSFLQCKYLATRYNEINDEVKNTMFQEDYNRIVFEEWNKDLFLALAAMTDNPNGIKGEWWKFDCDHDGPLIKGNLYKPKKHSLTKPSSQEIINHFTKQSTTMSTIEERTSYKITVEQFKQLHSIACSDWKNKLQTWVKGTDLFTSHVTLTNEQVSEIFKAATTSQLPIVKEVFPEFGKKLTYDDVAKELFVDKTAFCFKNNAGDLFNCAIYSVETAIHLSNSTSKEQLESLLALNQLANVAKYLNEGWKASFKNSMGKHCLYIEGTIIRVTCCYDANKGVIYFKTEELAKKAIEILGEEIIRKALNIGCH